MQWVRRQRRFASVVALSLVLKLIIAGLHMPMAVAAASADPAGGAQDTSISAPSYSQFIICTPSGIKTLILDEDGEPIEVPSAPQATTDCGLCSVLQAGSAALAPDKVSATLPEINSPTLHRAHEAPCSPRAPQLARGQDPPRL